MHLYNSAARPPATETKNKRARKVLVFLSSCVFVVLPAPSWIFFVLPAPSWIESRRFLPLVRNAA